MFVSCHFYGNEPQVQKFMLVGCDWWISIRLVCYACRKMDIAMDVTLNVAVISSKLLSQSRWLTTVSTVYTVFTVVVVVTVFVVVTVVVVVVVVATVAVTVGLLLLLLLFGCCCCCCRCCCCCCCTTDSRFSSHGYLYLRRLRTSEQIFPRNNPSGTPENRPEKI